MATIAFTALGTALGGPLGGALGSLVGNQLDRARETYDKALSQLYLGRGNLIKQAADFKDLGVSVQRELPEELVERASLELEMEPAAPADPADEPHEAPVDEELPL